MSAGRSRGGRGKGGGRGGEYYRNKYGGGGRGRRGGDSAVGDDEAAGSIGDSRPSSAAGGRMASAQELSDILRRIDGRPYGAYRDLEGCFALDGFSLHVDRVQSDPFAPPSRLHAVVPSAVAAFPPSLRDTRIRRTALCDYLTRAFCAAAAEAGADRRTASVGWSGAKGGEVTIDAPQQHVVERTGVTLHQDGAVEARFTVALPARGRSIMGEWALDILGHKLPALIAKSLRYAALDGAEVNKHVVSVEDQAHLRSSLQENGLVAFVADGAVLPRESGASDRPMDAARAVLFESPASLRRSFQLPSGRTVTGMAVLPGVTLIVGGGFHGKSTLLEALSVGVYDHVPGDGREFVCVDPAAVKVRAEDGRCVTSVDITPFIDNLPFGKSTSAFSTADASGSTSQAANIVEAIESGAKCLLIDEDTTAANLMTRDRAMQMLVAPEKEPITPFISKVRPLFEQLGVSTLLVVGGAGDFFAVADAVIALESYKPKDVTAQAKQIAAQHCQQQQLGLSAAQAASFFSGGRMEGRRRVPHAAAFATSGKVTARGKDKVQYGEVDIDLSAVEQLVEASQTRAIGDALRHLANTGMRRGLTVPELLDQLEADFTEEGLDVLAPNAAVSNYARPRRFEVAAALNRFRSASVAIS